MHMSLAASGTGNDRDISRKNRVDSLLATMVHQLSLLVSKDQGECVCGGGGVCVCVGGRMCVCVCFEI